jgi:hypothetical protein
VRPPPPAERNADGIGGRQARDRSAADPSRWYDAGRWAEDDTDDGPPARARVRVMQSGSGELDLIDEREGVGPECRSGRLGRRWWVGVANGRPGMGGGATT